MFIGRKKELNELNFRFNNSKKEFGVIYGRRRIGKSTLINEFLKDKPNIFFQAKKDSMYGNLRSFSYEIDKLLDLPKSFVFSSMEEAFDSLIEYAKGKRFVIAIDEYPYIVNQDASFPSILQEAIDRAPENLFFLISGSDVGMLKNELEDHNSPLYKRRTFEMNVTKLKYSESLEYLKNVDNETKIKYLSFTSTYPYYLSAMDFDIPFEENIKRLLFNEYGTFFTLPDQLLSNSLNTQDVYNAILYAVSKRKRSNKEIAEYIHEDEAKVSKYIKTLLQSELLDRRETYNGNKKTVYYEIGDPMLRFWYMFIFNNMEKIRMNGEFVYNNLREDIKQFICYGFEEVSRLYMDELNSKGLLGNIFAPFKPYKVEKSILNRSIEIDGLSNDDEKLIVMECKYRKEKFTLSMLKHLEESASVFPSKYNRVYYLFSKNGFDDEIKKIQSDKYHIVELDDMFNI
jgi:AAA+ ATPase superfamily predicted ATPase